MSPSTPHIVSQLRQLIYYHLDCNLPRNALAFSERLRGYEPKSSEAAYLEGLCHLRLGQSTAAYHSTKIHGTRGTHLGCSYVFAQACLGLERYMEGITATEKSKAHWSGKSNWSESMLLKHWRYLADKRRGRQTYGNSKTAVTRRGSCLLLAREIMARPRRHKSSDRNIRRVAEAQPLHVGCFPRIMRAWYVFMRYKDSC